MNGTSTIGSSIDRNGISTGKANPFLWELKGGTFGAEVETQDESDESAKAFQSPGSGQFNEKIQEVTNFFVPTIRPYPEVVSDIRAQVVIRKHIAVQILDDLQQIQKFTGKPRASMFASNILNLIREMRDKIPFDPFVEVAMALHDAMAHENSWLDYRAEQYQGAYEILKKIVPIERLKNEKTEKAILDLDKLGFELLPFELCYDSAIQGEED